MRTKIAKPKTTVQKTTFTYFLEMTIYTNIFFLQMTRLCHSVIIIHIEYTPDTAHEPKAMPETSDDSNLAADSDV